MSDDLTLRNEDDGVSVESAKSFLEVLGVEPTQKRINAVIQLIQNNNTTIHARESDHLPDAENAAKWNSLVPGSAKTVIDLVTDVVRGNRNDAAALNGLRIENEREGFNVSRIVALGCVPIALLASYLGIPENLCIAIVVMGIGGPTAASFFANWGGRSKE